MQFRNNLKDINHENIILSFFRLLNVLEVIAPFKHFNKLREFVQMKLPPGFPVKLGKTKFRYNCSVLFFFKSNLVRYILKGNECTSCFIFIKVFKNYYLSALVFLLKCLRNNSSRFDFDFFVI